MLAEFRHATRGLFATIILGVLIIAFALWGVQGAFDNISAGNDVASVGRFAVTRAELSRNFDQQLKAAQEQGRQITKAQAIAMGAPQQVLLGLVDRHVSWDLAARLGVSVSDKQVADVIMEQISQRPDLHDQISGGVDRQAFGRALAERGFFSMQEYENELRHDLSANLALHALTAGLRAPTSFGKLELVLRSERRTVSRAIAPIALVGPAPVPNDEQLQAFYTENRDRLATPEYRSALLVFARTADFLARTQVSDADIEREFEQTRAQRTTPEKRSFEQISATSQAAADTAAQRIARGEALATVARAMNLPTVRFDSQAKDALPDNLVADAAFAMHVGDPARVVQGRVGNFAVIELIDVTPASAPRLEDVREEIRHTLAADAAAAARDEAISKFDDARSAGQDLSAAARANGLDLVEIEAVDQGGHDPKGAPVAVFANQPNLVRAIFETQPGDTSDFLPAGEGNDVVIQVRGSTPPGMRPMEEVRDDLIRAWGQRERLKKLNALGKQVEEAVRGGQSFADAVRAHGLRMIETHKSYSGQETRGFASPRLGAQVFGADVNAVISDLTADGQGLEVIQLEAIHRDDPAEHAAEVEQLRAALAQQMTSGLTEAISQDAHNRANPRTNERMLASMFPPEQGEDAQQ